MNKKVLPNPVLMEGAQTLLEEGREVVMTPLGSSMLPFIRGGKDSVTLLRKADVTPGDMLLVCLSGKRYVLHRLIAVDGDRLTLQGDGNLVGTETCTRADVLGTVVAVNGRRVGNGRWWRRLPYIVRRVILAILRRLI